MGKLIPRQIRVLRSDIPGETAAIGASFAGGPGFNALEILFNKQLGLGGRPIMDARSAAPQQVGQLGKYLGTRIGTVNDLGVTLPRLLANLAPGGAPAGNAATAGISWLGLFPKITPSKP